MSKLTGAAHLNSSSKKEYIRRRKTRIGASIQNRTALYLRVSTPDQKPDLQYDDLHDHAERAKLNVVGEHLDVSVSGPREGLPQFGTLMASARNRDLNCVLVLKFDRIARSTRHLLNVLGV